LIDVLLGRINSKVGSRAVPSWLSEVQLVYSYVKEALEARPQLRSKFCQALKFSMEK
jgi:hypothetical protein